VRLAPPTSLASYRFRLHWSDIALVVLAPCLALMLRDPTLLSFDDPFWPPSSAYQFWLISILCGAGSLLGDGISRFFSARDAMTIFGAAATAVGATSFVAFTVSRLDGIPRSTPLIYGLVLVGGLISTRVVRRLLHWERANSRAIRAAMDVRRIMLVGVDGFTAAAIKLVDSQPERSTLVVAVADDRPSVIGRKVSGVTVVGPFSELGRIIDEYAVHGVAVEEIWVSDKVEFSAGARRAFDDLCESRGIHALKLSEAFNLSRSSPAAAPVAAPAAAPVSFDVSDYIEQKRIYDIGVALILGVALFPVAIVVAGLIATDVGVPVLFWQQRIGRHGRKFLLYKFRTYRAPYDSAGNEIPEEQRLSNIGRFVRSSRLDEIPQLYNILVGDMSLIGPRPLLPHDQPLDPHLRLLVRPGITGWAQINGATMLTPEEKEALDVWYVRHASLALDLRILLGTLRVTLTGQKIKPATVHETLQWRQSAPAAAEARTNPE
jgi:lipopolysaccharide/colanic/teichoic acid biosynthesis glycosyltransferase